HRPICSGALAGGGGPHAADGLPEGGAVARGGNAQHGIELAGEGGAGGVLDDRRGADGERLLPEARFAEGGDDRRAEGFREVGGAGEGGEGGGGEADPGRDGGAGGAQAGQVVRLAAHLGGGGHGELRVGAVDPFRGDSHRVHLPREPSSHERPRA